MNAELYPNYCNYILREAREYLYVYDGALPYRDITCEVRSRLEQSFSSTCRKFSRLVDRVGLRAIATKTTICNFRKSYISRYSVFRIALE